MIGLLLEIYTKNGETVAMFGISGTYLLINQKQYNHGTIYY